MRVFFNLASTDTDSGGLFELEAELEPDHVSPVIHLPCIRPYFFGIGEQVELDILCVDLEAEREISLIKARPHGEEVSEIVLCPYTESFAGIVVGESL